MKVNLTNVFERNADAYLRKVPIVINEGGQGSSKTYSLLQNDYLIAKCRAPKRISVISYALPHLKQGAIADFEKILYAFGENPDRLKVENKYRINGSVIEFFGVEGNLAIAHGPRRDILHIVESNRRISYDVYDMLASRTKETVFLEYNPDQEFWVHDKIIPNFEHEIIRSNFYDNPWLPEAERQRILSKKDKVGFENWWRVYGLGELGKLEGAIFTNWEFGEFDESLAYGFGEDFGFNAPDALVKVAIDYKRNIIYLDEKIYLEGNSFEQLREQMQKYCKRHELVIADCADARMISQLRNYFNIKGVNKQRWSKQQVIKMMQGFKIVITNESVNLAKELNNYVWNDRKAGIPINAFNHLIDAAQYYFQENVNPKTAGVWHT